MGPDDYFPATGDDRNQKSNQGCLGDVSQVHARTDVEKLPAQTSTPDIRRIDNSDGMPRIGNTDTHKEQGRMMQSTQGKMLRLIIQTKRRYKKSGTKRQDQRRKMMSTGDESEDGQSSHTHKDQDSDVSFENDTEEEIDSTEIEEEDWIECIKRSTSFAHACKAKPPTIVGRTSLSVSMSLSLSMDMIWSVPERAVFASGWRRRRGVFR